MHEFGLAQEIFRIVMAAALRNRATEVRKVVVVAGAMRAVVESQLAFHFTVIARGSMAQRAQLVVETLPARGRCRQCEAEFDAPDFGLACPRCGSAETSLIQGGELLVKEIEIAGS